MQDEATNRQRPWRIIARDVLRERDRARVNKLLCELFEAIEEQFMKNPEVDQEPDSDISAQRIN